MGQVTKADCNPILVLLISFVPIIGQFLAAKVFMGMEKRALGCLVFSFVPILSFVVAIDNFLTAQKLQKGESVDEFHHEIGFLSALPLLHE